jgi:TonB family protein
MKYLSIFFILLFSISSVAQKTTVSGSTGRAALYINNNYNFSFAPPIGSKQDQNFNTASHSIVSYSCLVPECVVPGVFSLMSVKSMNVPLADVIETYKLESAQDQIAKVMINRFPADSNVTVLLKRYVNYSDRPAIRIDFSFTKDGQIFSGVTTALFIDERKILLGFTSITENSQSEKWNKVTEEAIDSVVLLTDKQTTATNSTGQGIATRIIGGNSSDGYLGTGKPVAGKILNSAARKLPKPEYPPAALAIRATGVVLVEVTIDEQGNVVSAKAVSGHPLLQRACVEAARQAKFNPADLTGGKLTGVLLYNFEAPRSR